jgi:hypothetical protein
MQLIFERYHCWVVFRGSFNREESLQNQQRSQLRKNLPVEAYIRCRGGSGRRKVMNQENRSIAARDMRAGLPGTERPRTMKPPGEVEQYGESPVAMAPAKMLPYDRSSRVSACYRKMCNILQ